MAKVTRKLPVATANKEQQTSCSRRKKKVSFGPGCRGGKKTIKKTKKLNKPLRRSPRKKVSERMSQTGKKLKKAKGQPLFGHYHRLKEKLDYEDIIQGSDNLDMPTTSSDLLSI
ncbi:uncharacterized protein CXorf51A-like [Erinaceus europaeus]|uniref:Uncharacterized protein CXorf51A-like n=1 Tax=Erinaceus europaeus TaxID=9365 RepID=A0ABM3WQT9_ERIEU|nr:uncharacterized protein CXorf51A-like [Erinaceus europaeus]